MKKENRDRYREGADIEVRNKKGNERAWGSSSSDSGERGEGDTELFLWT